MLGTKLARAIMSMADAAIARGEVDHGRRLYAITAECYRVAGHDGMVALCLYRAA